MSTTDGIAIHHRNDRFGQTTDLHLHIEHRETGHPLLIDIAATSLHVHVATRAEGMLHVVNGLALRHRRHGTRQQHHADALHLTAQGESLRQFPRGLGGKGITVLRTVDRDLGNAVVFLEEYLFECFDRFPISHILLICYSVTMSLKPLLCLYSNRGGRPRHRRHR